MKSPPGKAQAHTISITGSRQSGKTTLARACFPSYAYMNLEASDTRLLVEENPRGFISQYLKRGVIIDEAQRVPALFSGMYPPLHDRKIDANLFYSSYIQTYIERDLRSMRNTGTEVAQEVRRVFGAST